MKNLVIGVLGGMGTYATIHLFQQYAAIFPALKEWDRPRIIIDNYCTMPSRVRAFLLNERVNELVIDMTESMQNLVNNGCNKIILACNTSHLFLPLIYERFPELEEKVVHIIKNCVDEVYKKNVSEIFLLGTEGTIDSGIYQDFFLSRNIKCITPSKNEYFKLRNCIESVKQNKYTQETKDLFLDLVNRYNYCVLGCTELPILYERYRDIISCKMIFDPVEISLKKIQEEFECG